MVRLQQDITLYGILFKSKSLNSTMVRLQPKDEKFFPSSLYIQSQFHYGSITTVIKDAVPGIYSRTSQFHYGSITT